jgi:hypothetical protein
MADDNKIEFEDRTKPQEKSAAEIEHLASSFFSGAVRVGILGGFSPKEILLAFLVGAKDLSHYSLETNVITEEELKETQAEANRMADERAKAIKESGLIDVIKRMTKELEGKGK